MTLLKDKYRGTVEYHLVYQELVAAARYRGTVTYQEIAQIMGLPLQGSHMGSQTGYMLGEISEDEIARGRPMLSAVAVGVSGEPGEGFYGLAKELNLLADDTPEVKRKFWQEQKAKVHKVWQKKL